MKNTCRKNLAYILIAVITWPVVTFLFTAPVKADDISLNIISRQEWGANEDYRFDNQGEELWPREYQKVEKIIIHHTAGSNGGSDPAATVRGVYRWHAVSLDWGDIGYNYLIDRSGNIYEGRYGGDAVVGGHAFNESEKKSYNHGTIGIALLGNYETTDGLTTAARQALTDLIAVKSREFGLDPGGKSVFLDQDLPNIFTHRDVDQTLCPGKNIYRLLDQIREEATDKYKSLPSLPKSQKKASLIRQSAASLTLGPGATKEIWFEYKNTGNTTWQNYTANTPYLAVKGISSLKTNTWLTNVLVTVPDEPNVKPGETVRFTFKIKAPNDQIRLDQNFFLKWGDTWLDNTLASIHLEITGHEYAANEFSHDILPATFPGTLRKVTLSYQNIGLKGWPKNEVFLLIYDEKGGKPAFRHSSWPQEDGKIPFNEEKVNSQGTATFSFFQASPSAGHYSTIYKLVRANGNIVAGSLHSVRTRVDSTYQAELSDQSVPVAMLNSWIMPVTLKFKNTGLSAWDRNVVLKVYDGDWRNSAFSHPSWPSPWGDFSFQEERVRPGETATFRLTLFPPAWPGTYFTVFKLEYQGRPDIIIPKAYTRLIRIDKTSTVLPESYQADFLSVSAPPAMFQLQRYTNEVKIKNTGTATWGRNVVLNIYDADFRETYFRDETWPAFEGGIRFLEQRVRPGETATFRFIYRAPWQIGLYRNRFTLALSGQEYLTISGFQDSWLTRVDPR